ncbi:BTB/POZ domain-containing protein 7 [Acipenser ruthenus]|uniref:BTB/POZ domain-containing protein 7 n=1 Tax=Acipenser ruthenus TaxID=7906 RepID=UPI00145A1949|nr:BTB/POZ domain-containing protein 7 [Acipenser ruthenus]XP_033892635.1 BTB/POZ domain-containing protein 7 [Acipenser ruthenus]XP_033892636.1 BTB/POZ domain-containing protein 7 [Acipenser ruthenus]XP_058843548.1 BTB/POZ domain-containing protein 7 [Acipenser ruthenus]XP_058843549.1 BTB/POZ domain-containing protein 7 [Acipenser ruthenus]XP_058843550.1 BTB/POZ domain-containing protein 7 [Acipenser ruthenus]
MGVNASNYPHSCSPRIGGNSQTQQTFIGTSSYSHQGYGCESKLYSLDHGHEKPQDKKKKSSGLATLKKKFIKRRKSSRSADHAKQMRELLSGWDVRDANALVEEYEGTTALKELNFQASLARPENLRLQKDLSDLYEYKYCTDVDLLFQDTCFPVHRAILAARCPFFKSLLSSSPEYGAEIVMDINTAGIDMPMFSALLHYLYTGEFGIEDSRFQNVDILVQLSEEFGTPNSLDVDMRGLFDYMCYYDSVLSFSSDSELVEAYGGNRGCLDEELRAHKAVLSARSPFFRNLLQRRIRTGEEITDRTLQTPTRIILDESIIPKKYAKVILHCMYTDIVDLSYVLHCSPSIGSLSEVQALVAGKGHMSRAEEAMELYHIALFLEFNMLAQGCEDIIMESISLDSLIVILRWSSQPYGSKWVYRQALHFLCEEFSQVMTSDVLYELNKDDLLTAIQSDYLQASEQDILKYVIKWGEHQLIKRMADREPNLLSGTAHSVNKRGVKRRDLDIEELKEILSSLLPFVRIAHILPTNSEVLSDTMKRGLISTPPSDMLPTAEGGKANAWLRQKNAGIYVRPRLFSPYVEEAKAVLDEIMVEQTDLVRLRMVRMSNVPDTLYMVNNAVPQCCHMINHQQISSSQCSPPTVVANEIPVPKLQVVKDMIRRLQELRHTDQVQRAYALNCGEGATVSYELQIRVLREFGLPDAAAELLQNPHKFFPEERFGDESPVLTVRQHGRCRINSTPTVESMFTDLESFAAFHPPLPPPPPPYHPPATPSHGQLKAGWRPRIPSQPPSRSFSYPCNHSLLHLRPSSKHGVPTYPSGAKAIPPDCTNTAGVGRTLHPEKQGNMEPVINEFMPDIAMGVSAMNLKERRMPELTVDAEGHVGVAEQQHQQTSSSAAASHYQPSAICHPSRHGHNSRKKHAAEQKAESRQEYPDLYDFTCRPTTPTSSRHIPSPSQGTYAGPDLYSHSRPSPGSLPPSYLPDMHSQRPGPDPLHLDVLEQPPQRLDLALAAQNCSAAGAHGVVRVRSKNETDLTSGLGSGRATETYEERPPGRRSAPDGTGGPLEPTGALHPHRNSASEEAIASRERRSPNKPDYQYKKSAL